MSASDVNTAIYMTDTPNQIKNKINKYAFSGGGETVELHKLNGGNPDVDISYTYLSFFLEDDDELKSIYDVIFFLSYLSVTLRRDPHTFFPSQSYKAGTLLTGDLKEKCVATLQPLIKAFQERRAGVSEETLNEFMAVRPLKW